jgi:beta-glucosidase
MVAWFPGEEGAPAVADILTGLAEPGGRLPLTIPRRLDDVGAQRWYPGEGGKVVYGEGLMVGYRHFDHAGIDPAYCFGHGLTFTTFEYGVPQLEVEGWHVQGRIPITNTGDRAGTEIVQLYVGRPGGDALRPPQELKAFQKIRVGVGETKTVLLELDARSFATWDEGGHRWDTRDGAYELLFGASSRDIRQRVRVNLPGSVQ